MLGEALIPLVILFTLVATAGLAAVPQACSTITPIRVSSAPAGPSSSDSSIRANGRRNGGEPIGEQSTLSPGESLIITAYDFAPGARVSVRLSGQPSADGTDVADTSGTVHFLYQLPSELQPGRYRVIVEDAGGATSRPSPNAGGSNVMTVVPQFALLAFAVG